MTARSLLVAFLLAALVGCTPGGRGRAHPSTLPRFSLQDPRGARHDREELLAQGGLVLIVTAPTLASGDAQEAWSEALASTAPRGGRWSILEDLSQSSFPGTAEDRMKDEFDPVHPPLLLLDRDGALRRALGVGEESTVVLVYSAAGALVHTDASEASEAGARRAWKALED